MLPLAIKYAPYALMFLEAPENGASDVQSLYEQFEYAQKRPLDAIPALDAILKKEIVEKNKRYTIVAVHLDSYEKAQQIQKWLTANGQTYKIRHFIATHDVTDPGASQKIAHLLGQRKTSIFIADGPLETLSSEVPLPLKSLMKSASN